MSMCEKCWTDAYLRGMTSGRSQVDCYEEIMEERKDNPCTLEQQGMGEIYLDEGEI